MLIDPAGFNNSRAFCKLSRVDSFFVVSFLFPPGRYPKL